MNPFFNKSSSLSSKDISSSADININITSLMGRVSALESKVNGLIASNVKVHEDKAKLETEVDFLKARNLELSEHIAQINEERSRLFNQLMDAHSNNIKFLQIQKSELLKLSEEAELVRKIRDEIF